MFVQPAGVAGQLSPGGATVDGHGRLGGVRRSRAGNGGDVVDQGSVGVVPDRGHDGDAQQGDGAAQRLVAEREQVGQRAAAAGDDHHLHLGDRGQLAQGGGDPRGGVAILDGRECPHEAPGPAAPAQPGDDVVAGLSPLAGDHADGARQPRALEPLLGLEQPLGVQALAQALERHQQVALARETQLGDSEAERRRGGGASRVVVAAAADHDPHPVGECDVERVEVGAPHRARQRAVGVAQLEVDADSGRPQSPHLADQLHACEVLQPALELRGV